MELEVDYSRIINAWSYEDICDYSIIPPEGKVFKSEISEKDCIIFCKTDFIGLLFDNLRNSNNNYIIITHHSDYSIDSTVFSYKPACIKKWFAINAIHDDPSLICIPLGIKTHSGIYLEERYMTKWFVPKMDSLKDNDKENIIYCNWTNTNPYRNSIIDKLKNNNLNYKLDSDLTFDLYANNMSKCKYVISPPGNGIDCHRTWEALYIGCIPIVIKNKIYDNWPELPILQVNDYSELTNEVLDSFSKKEFNYEKLYMEYWKKIIKDNLC